MAWTQKSKGLRNTAEKDNRDLLTEGAVMGNIEWKESYSIGIEHLDYQHKKLFELVNLFFETAETTKCQELVGPVLLGVLAYTKFHFSAEEEEMRKLDFPELASHRAQHRRLREYIQLQIDRLNANREIDLESLKDFLKQWLTEHIPIDDAKIGVFTKQSQPVHR